MPTGSIREYAEATGQSYRTIYDRIKRGAFDDSDAELIEEQQPVFRIKWRSQNAKKST